MRNPRLYLAPHLPRPPCKVFVLGPPHSGKTTVSRLVAQRYNAKVILPPSLSLAWSANFIGQKSIFPIALIDLVSMLSLIGQKSCPIKKRKCSCIHVFSRAWLQLRIVAWLSDWLTVQWSDWQLYLYFVTIPVEYRKKLLTWSRSFNKYLANLALTNEKPIQFIIFPYLRCANCANGSIKTSTRTFRLRKLFSHHLDEE